MKKFIIFIFVIPVAAVAIVLLWNVVKNSTSQKIDNSLKPNTETVEFELSKDFSAIKVINIVDTLKAVDAFGNKLKIGEWYVQSNITCSVFPINTKSTNYTNLGWLMANGNKESARVKITNGDPLGAYVDVEILLLGDKLLVLNDLEQYQVISIK